MKKSLRVAIAALFFSAVFSAESADIDLVKAGAGKSRLDLSGIRGSGKAGGIFKSTLENDLKLSGWFLISAPGKGVLLANGTATDGGGRLSVSIKVSSRAGKTYLSDRYSGAST